MELQKNWKCQVRRLHICYEDKLLTPGVPQDPGQTWSRHPPSHGYSNLWCPNPLCGNASVPAYNPCYPLVYFKPSVDYANAIIYDMQITITLYWLGIIIRKKSVHFQYRCDFFHPNFCSRIGWIQGYRTSDTQDQLYDGKWELPGTHPDPGGPISPNMLVNVHLHRVERHRKELKWGLTSCCSLTCTWGPPS